LSTIVLVHGIAQEHRSADELEAEWLPALAGGLRLAGFPDLADRLWRDRAPRDLEARMAFYGDYFRHPGRMGASGEQLTGEQAELAEDLARAWLERAATDASSPRERAEAAAELARVFELPGQRQGAGATQRRAIAALARVRWFAPFGMALAERFVLRALAQVTGYLNDEQVRAHALSQVELLLTPDTRVLIGHSLGSVVAYEAAQRMQRLLPLLITVGSPLGLRTIVYERLRPQPPCFPASVARWVNIADHDDFIAAAPDLSALFSAEQPSSAVFEGAWTVDNGAKPHLATFYLNSREAGEPIGQVLVGL